MTEFEMIRQLAPWETRVHSAIRFEHERHPIECGVLATLTAARLTDWAPADFREFQRRTAQPRREQSDAKRARKAQRAARKAERRGRK